MKCMILPSLLEADQKLLGEQLLEIENAGIQQVHIDIMDGQFVPLISSGTDEVKRLRTMTSMKLDTHLMVQKPAECIGPVIRAGADSIVFHIEACRDMSEAEKLLKEIHAEGCEAGIALNPDTEPEDIPEYIIHSTDKVLVMSVMPGRKGQSFRPETYARIRKVRRQFGTAAEVEVDGSITEDNIRDVFRSGADEVVIGRALFHPDLRKNLNKFSGILNDMHSESGGQKKMACMEA